MTLEFITKRILKRSEKMSIEEIQEWHNFLTELSIFFGLLLEKKQLEKS